MSAQKWNVLVPFTGFVVVTISGERPRHCNDAYDRAIDVIAHDDYVIGNDDTENVSGLEAEYCPAVTEGNVTHAVLNECEWEPA